MMGNVGPVTQSGNILSWSYLDNNGNLQNLNGVVNGDSVSFTVQAISPAAIGPDDTTDFTGVLDENTIRGDFAGFGPAWTYTVNDGPDWNVIVTWTGTFTVIIQK